MIHATIDLETIDTCPEATVLSIGCVKFNPLDNSEPHSELYFKVCIDDQDRLGRTSSDDTIAWWSKQNPKIMEEAFDQTGAITVDESLRKLSKFAVGVDTFWGQGYGFDYTIMENMFRQGGMPIPWQFWQVMDCRTIFNMMPVDPRKAIQQNLHSADNDAYYQAVCVQGVYQHWGIQPR